jgi:hypothetical protein
LQISLGRPIAHAPAGDLDGGGHRRARIVRSAPRAHNGRRLGSVIVHAPSPIPPPLLALAVVGAALFALSVANLRVVPRDGSRLVRARPRAVLVVVVAATAEVENGVTPPAAHLAQATVASVLGRDLHRPRISTALGTQVK